MLSFAKHSNNFKYDCRKFWKTFDTAENDTFLSEAIETLQQLKTTFSAVEKLIVIRNTHYQIEQVNFLQVIEKN